MLAWAAWLWLGLPAAHAEQRELQLGLQPVYGITYIDQRSPSGGGGNLQLSYGITDAVAIQLHGGLTAHPLAEDKDRMLAPGLLLTWQASVGVIYALDIVRVVPYFEASVGLLGVTRLAAAGAAAGTAAGTAAGESAAGAAGGKRGASRAGTKRKASDGASSAAGAKRGAAKAAGGAQRGTGGKATCLVGTKRSATNPPPGGAGDA